MLTREKDLLIKKSPRSFEPGRPFRDRSSGALTTKPKFDRVITGLGIVVFSFVFCSLFNFKQSTAKALEAHFLNFKWLVLVEGEQVQIDEVGRFLKQLDNVSRASYVSRGEALNRIKLLSSNREVYNTIEPNFLPASWEVSWENFYSIKEIQFLSIVDEINDFPGVSSVSFDVKAWNYIQSLSTLNTRVRVILSFLMFLTIVLAAVFLGVIFFTYGQKKISRPAVFSTLLPGILAWSLGVLLAQMVLGPSSLFLLLGGVFVGLGWMLWEGRIPNQ